MKKNIIAIDIGNTTMTFGFFSGEQLVRKTKIPTAEPALYRSRFRRFIASKPIDRVVVSSVVPHALGLLLKELPKVVDCAILVAGKHIEVPIRNCYRKRREVGQDRLVNAYAAKELYGSPAVIVDFGTAVTFDVVSRKGEYLGGLIMPGIGISLASLYEKTALLPKITLKDAPHIIAKDTVSSMRGGILFGFGAMCDGLVARYKKILGDDLKVIATGGNARLMEKYAHSIKIVDEDITLQGLRMLSNKKDA
jgi:type III pantothenate kinase